MAEHSPEPWGIVRRDPKVWRHFLSIVDAHGCEVTNAATGVYGYLAPTLLDENFQRTVACVNACKGIPTEKLVSGNVTIHLDLTRENLTPCYCITGSKEDVTRFAQRMLEDKGDIREFESG